ncbi:hypothetical protein FVF58_21995 [Paraburkholderia panacisoli]|uniref:Uncharacterized protein n=1 Tax=Paraburkholderia panacisoli TaxID=2603818 RepID=A0A5B0H165_9BURK|nr:hypothetical protein [Paraburkholderia panacisoli]KAA1008957.1 hypothetical protein FVF58_21995 [Paraburkholderia panacisoli]
MMPSVLIAHGAADPQHPHTNGIRFSSIYGTTNPATTSAADAIAALSVDDDTVAELPDGRRLRLHHGALDNGVDPEGTCRVATDATDQWRAVGVNHSSSLSSSWFTSDRGRP